MDFMDFQGPHMMVKDDIESVLREMAVHSEFILGKDVQELEQRLCEYVGTDCCVSVSSGTSGLLLALRAAGVGKGDSVLCTTFSYFATADVIALTGAQPLFVDINPNTFNIDPYCLEYVLRKCVRTKTPLPRALIAVDLFGLPCDYDALEEICARFDIVLIEDMAQSFGASYRGKKTGSFGHFSVASFFLAKPLGGLGDGGAVFCHSEQDARMLRSMRKDGKAQQALGTGDTIGSATLDSIQTSIISEKLKAFDEEHIRRQAVAARYRKNLSGHVKLQQEGEDYTSAHTHFVIALHDDRHRAEVMERLHENSIPSHIYQAAPLRDTGACNDWNRITLVNTSVIAKKILAIPMHPYLSNNVVDYICDCILQRTAAAV